MFQTHTNLVLFDLLLEFQTFDEIILTIPFFHKTKFIASAILNASKLNTWFWNSCSEDYINNAAGILLNAINKTVEYSIPEQKNRKNLLK